MAIRKVVSRSIGTDVIVAEDLAANSITVSELSDNAVTNAKLHEDVHRGGRKNLLINGAMQVAQRSTSVSGIDTGTPAYHTVDRWKYNSDLSDVTTQSQEADAPAGFKYSWKILVTTTDTNVTNDQNRVEQYLESQDLQHLLHGTADA